MVPGGGLCAPCAPDSGVDAALDATTDPPTEIVETPSFAPPGGEQADVHTVSLHNRYGDVCYTVDGSTPTCSGICSSAATIEIPITQTNTTLRALACRPNVPPSSIRSETYTLRAAAAVPSPPPPGKIADATSVTLASETPGTTIHYTTDGTPVSCTNGAVYTGSAFSVAANATLATIACRAGFEPSTAQKFLYGVTTPAPFFVTGPDRAQLASDPTQVDAPEGTTFTESVRLLIPDGTRRSTDVDCFTTDGSEPVCWAGSTSCAHGTRYEPPTPSDHVTSNGKQPIAGFTFRKFPLSRQEHPVIKVVRCREEAGGSVVTSSVASYSYRLKVGPIAVSYVTRDSSFAVVTLASKENDVSSAAVSTGTGVRTEFVGGSAGAADHGVDAIGTGHRSPQPGAIGRAGSEPRAEDEELICYTLDGTEPRCTQVEHEYGAGVACGTGSTDHRIGLIGSSTFAAANTSVPGGVPATAGTPQRALPFTLRAIGCKVGFENSDERQIVFGN